MIWTRSIKPLYRNFYGDLFSITGKFPEINDFPGKSWIISKNQWEVLKMIINPVLTYEIIYKSTFFFSHAFGARILILFNYYFEFKVNVICMI